MSKSISLAKHKLAIVDSVVGLGAEVFSSKPWTLMALVTPIFLFLLVHTAAVQVNSGAESVYAAEHYLVLERQVAAPRGLFYDREGTKLVVNESAYSLFLKLNSLSAEQEAILPQLLNSELGIAEEVVSTALANNTQRLILADGIGLEEALQIEAQLNSFEVELIPNSTRRYLFPEAYAHIIGYTGLASAEDVAAGAAGTDKVGKYRLEKILNEELSGYKGSLLEQVDTLESVNEVPGNNVLLTIDHDWQAKLYDLLGTQVNAVGADNGAAVIVEVETGDIWASASFPSFDSNIFTYSFDAEQYKNIIGDPRKPIVDKVIGLQAPPGSTFKLVSSYAALQYGAIDANTHYFSTGCMPLGNFQFCEFGKFYLGDLDIVRALTRSSNIFFCQSILKLSNEQSLDVFIQSAKNFGIGSKTGINLEGELAGIMPSPDYKQQTFREQWFGGDTCNTSIGQGMVLVTPLQMAMVVATIENGGKYMQPNLVKQIQDQSGTVVSASEPVEVRRLEMSQETMDLILAGMSAAVNSPEGTAYRFMHYLPGDFKAKTGSAETVEYKDGQAREGVDGWEVGSFEFEGKRFAFAVYLHFGGGGWNAAPVMQRFGECLFEGFGEYCEL